MSYYICHLEALNDLLYFVSSVYSQMQNVFAHLLESKLQYYVPEKFWKVFKLWGEVVNVREQQDAFDFYQSVIDQTDEQLKVGTDFHPLSYFSHTVNMYSIHFCGFGDCYDC